MLKCCKNMAMTYDLCNFLLFYSIVFVLCCQITHKRSWQHSLFKKLNKLLRTSYRSVPTTYDYRTFMFLGPKGYNEKVHLYTLHWDSFAPLMKQSKLTSHKKWKMYSTVCSLLLSFLSVHLTSGGQHRALAASPSSCTSASIQWHSQSFSAVRRPRPEHQCHFAAAQGQCWTQPPLHLWHQVRQMSRGSQVTLKPQDFFTTGLWLKYREHFGWGLHSFSFLFVCLFFIEFTITDNAILWLSAFLLFAVPLTDPVVWGSMIQ